MKFKVPFTKFEFNLKSNNSKTVEVNKDYLDNFFNVDKRFNGFVSHRPQLDPKETAGDEQILIPMYPLPLEIVYDISRYSDVLRTIVQHLRKEIFRHGYSVNEKFASKCLGCGKEYKNPVDYCEECGGQVRSPDLNEKKVLTNYLKSMNSNNQDLINISEQLNDDLEIVDDAFELCISDYYWTQEGDLFKEVPVEFLRMDPRWVRLICDKAGRMGFNQMGQKVMFCYEHRDGVHFNIDKCPKCGKKMFPAYYRSFEPDGKYVYYGEKEVKHRSKYYPSLTYGFSLVYSVWPKVVTLMNMDQFMKAYYTKQRPPRGIAFVNTSNRESMEKSWNWMLEQFKTNPHQIPMMAIERGDSMKGPIVEFVDFMKTMDEMQFIETRNEFRKIIGAQWGVMPLFQADVSASGGLNNEGLQITVTNRAVKDGQGMYHDDGGFYEWTCERLGIKDYKIVLNPNEEQDLISKEELKAKRIQNAKMMQDLGFSIMMSQDGEFEYDPIDEPVQSQTSKLGGFGGSTEQPPMNLDNQPFTGQPMGKSLNKGMFSKDMVTTITPGAYNPMHSRRKKLIKEIVMKEFNTIVKKEKAVVDLTKADKEMEDLASFIENSIFDKSFDGMTKSISERIKDYIINATVKGFDQERVKDYIQRVGKTDKVQASNIFRNENQSLRNKAREWSYKRLPNYEELKFDWVSIPDKRRTEICKNITERTKGGVSLDELKSIIEDEVDKAKGRGELPQDYDAREYKPHLGCRSIFKRHFE